MKIIEMSREQAQSYLNELNGFYRKGKPKVSDEEFDVLLDEYKSKFQDDDFIDKLLLREKGKVKLPVPMASLDKLKTIQKNGGIYSDSIKTTTQYLVVKDKSKTSSKMQLARKRGTQIISIDDLDMMMLF